MNEQVQLGFDKDGKLTPSLNDPLSFVKHYFEESAESVVGAAGGAGQTILSIPVPIGAVFMVFNIIASYYSSASLAGRMVIYQSTTAAVGGVDILLADIMFDPAAATAAGVAESKTLKGDKAPLFIVDNKEGAAIVYLNIEMPIFVGGALVADAVTQEYTVAINGVSYT
jgi:hypothetical protein